MEKCETRIQQMRSLNAEFQITGSAAVMVDRLMKGPEYRHSVRVLATTKVVETVNEAYPDIKPGALLLAADLIGVGGTEGVMGIGTVRVPAFKTLGAGRKHARDGGAWLAAAVETLNNLCHPCDDQRYEVSNQCPNLPVGWDVEEDGDIIFRNLSHEGMPLECRFGDVEAELLPCDWKVSVAAHGLMAAIDRPLKWGGHYQTESFGFRPVNFHGSAAYWSIALNKAIKEQATQPKVVEMVE